MVTCLKFSDRLWQLVRQLEKDNRVQFNEKLVCSFCGLQYLEGQEILHEKNCPIGTIINAVVAVS
jgi:hypothetical protein